MSALREKIETESNREFMEIQLEEKEKVSVCLSQIESDVKDIKDNKIPTNNDTLVKYSTITNDPMLGRTLVTGNYDSLGNVSTQNLSNVLYLEEYSANYTLIDELKNKLSSIQSQLNQTIYQLNGTNDQLASWQ
ncbi:12404_t:CDS:2, partial [Funneliformis geosporum]